MGLAERRALKDFQDNHFEPLKAEVDDAAGFDVPMEIDWDSLMKDDYAHLLIDGVTRVFFKPLAETFRAIAVDDMGKEALKSGLKKVIVRNSSDLWKADESMTFAEGVLTFDHDPYTNMDYGHERVAHMTKMLEKNL